ncbi:DUF4252 domain-containing protein [uncultured Bacteroides sp.]|jgi:hypothetical protein|uniref:DUF4252 domain-containing protein n=1 Tax=uncultured Bacteroides sp. TaxID=162156 RepID=UPI00260BF005|nr:DUF4252 domain-containing protein [uncultured Bacteroides sp.]
MKLNKILLAGVLLMLPLLCHAQKNIFNTYNDMKGVSSVYISKAMIEMNSNLFTKDIYIGKVSGQLDCVQILSTMDNIVKKDMRKDLRTLVQASKYELLMKQKGNVSSSEFYINRKGDKVKELIMIIDGAATLKFIYLVGEMTLKDIQNIMMYQNTSMNEGGSIYYIDGNSTLGSADIWGGLKGLEELKGLEGLENLKNLEGLKGLESLKDITKLKDSEYLKKRMNADQWKRFEKGMEMLEERFKNWE